MAKRDGLLRFKTLHFYFCDAKQFAKRMRMMATWAETECWPTELPSWLLVSRDNKGGGGPCRPASVTVELPLVTALPQSECKCD